MLSTMSSLDLPDRISSKTAWPTSLERSHQSRLTKSKPFVSLIVVRGPPLVFGGTNFNAAYCIWKRGDICKKRVGLKYVSHIVVVNVVRTFFLVRSNNVLKTHSTSISINLYFLLISFLISWPSFRASS